MTNAALLELAVTAARDAGRLLLERFHEPAKGVGTKSTPTDPVSDADREAEALILEAVRRSRPEDAILAEEGGGSEGRTGLRWVVDPLDGTVNFLFGIPQWAVSIAVEDAEGAVVAVVHDPGRAETFTAVRGEGSALNGRPAAVSAVTELSRALVATGFSYDAERRGRQARLLTRVIPRVRDVRRFGSAALDLAWVACGRYDGYYEAPIGAWDVAAGRLLVAEAGGAVSDLTAPDGEPGVAASARGIHEALLEAVGEE